MQRGQEVEALRILGLGIRGFRFKLARPCYLKNPDSSEVSTCYRHLFCKVSGCAELWGLEAVTLVVRN